MNIQFKRIYSEQKQICEKFGKCDINISSEYRNNNIDYKYFISLNLDNIDLKIILEDKYPFTPPILYINEKLYNNMLSLQDIFIKGELRKMDIECLCCKSKLCYNNWSPSYKLVEIIDEYMENRNIIIKIIYRKYLLLINKSNDNIFPQEIIEVISQYF